MYMYQGCTQGPGKLGFPHAPKIVAPQFPPQNEAAFFPSYMKSILTTKPFTQVYPNFTKSLLTSNLYESLYINVNTYKYSTYKIHSYTLME